MSLRPIVAALLVATLAVAQPAARPSLAEPSPSPVGRELMFASEGDIGSVGAEGGEARLLVADPALPRDPSGGTGGQRRDSR